MCVYMYIVREPQTEGNSPVTMFSLRAMNGTNCGYYFLVQEWLRLS